MSLTRKYANLVGRHPCRLLLGIWAVILLLTFITLQQGWLAINEAGDGEWNIVGEIQTDQEDAYEQATSNTGLYFDTTSSLSPVNRTTFENYDSISLIYDTVDGNVFSPANIRRICELEQLVVAHESYKDFCLIDGTSANRTCAVQKYSVTYQFYGSAIASCDELSQASVDTTLATIATKIITQNDLTYLFFMANDFVDSSKPPSQWVNKRTRTQFFIGKPVEVDRLPSKGKGDAEKETRKLYDADWVLPLQDRLFEKLDMQKAWLYASPYENDPFLGGEREEGAAADDIIKVKFFSVAMNQLEFAAVVNVDFTAVVFSVIFVYIYMTIHLGSLFMASLSLGQMMMSVPFTLFFYTAIFRVSYFSQMHILVIFLVLGVGADDVFVFVDKWKLTNEKLPLDMRLHETIDHALEAVFNTSFTTIIAFVATAISPIMPISAFGIFAALAIFMNYVFVVILTPCVVIVWEQRYAGYTYKQVACGCVRAKPTSRSGHGGVFPTKETMGDDVQGNSMSLDEVGASGVPKFFHKTLAPILNKKTFGVKLISMLIVAIGLGFFGIQLNAALQLVPPIEEERWFRDSHMYTGLQDYLRDNYAAGDEAKYMGVKFVIGILDIDRSDYNRWIPEENRGNAVYDENLHDSLSTEVGQRNFIAACDVLRNAPCDLVGCAQGPQDERMLYSGETLKCFMDDYVEWVTNGNVNETLPEGDDFSLKLQEFLATPGGAVHSENVGFDDSVTPARIQLAVITASASVLFRQPNNIIAPYYDFVTDVIQNDIRPIAVGSGDTFKSMFVTSPLSFSFMVTQDKLVQGLFNGLLICFPTVFVVLLLATSNILLAVYSTFTIAAIVAGVLGVAQQVGWALGTAETIAAVIVVGFSVDYTVHLVHIYELASDKSDRGARVDEALTRMGHTVLAGSITTFGSGAVMFICSLQFFFKMAVLICMTIFLSTLYSVFWLMALLALVGPQNGTGDIKFVKKFVKGCLGWDKVDGTAQKKKLSSDGSSGPTTGPVTGLV